MGRGLAHPIGSPPKIRHRFPRMRSRAATGCPATGEREKAGRFGHLYFAYASGRRSAARLRGIAFPRWLTTLRPELKRVVVRGILKLFLRLAPLLAILPAALRGTRIGARASSDSEPCRASAAATGLSANWTFALTHRSTLRTLAGASTLAPLLLPARLAGALSRLTAADLARLVALARVLRSRVVLDRLPESVVK